MIKKKILMSRSMVPNSVFYYTILLIDILKNILSFQMWKYWNIYDLSTFNIALII